MHWFRSRSHRVGSRLFWVPSSLGFLIACGQSCVWPAGDSVFSRAGSLTSPSLDLATDNATRNMPRKKSVGAWPTEGSRQSQVIDPRTARKEKSYRRLELRPGCVRIRRVDISRTGCSRGAFGGLGAADDVLPVFCTKVDPSLLSFNPRKETRL